MGSRVTPISPMSRPPQSGFQRKRIEGWSSAWTNPAKRVVGENESAQPAAGHDKPQKSASGMHQLTQRVQQLEEMVKDLQKKPPRFH